MQGTGFSLTQYRTWLLLEALVVLYSQAHGGLHPEPRNDVNDCIQLQPQGALQNGPSYIYYAASEFPEAHPAVVVY